MSERDEASGQFTAEDPSAGLYGNEALLVESGYTSMEDPVKQQEEQAELDERSAAAEISAARNAEVEPDPIKYYTPDGSDVDASEAVTLERASRDLETWRESNSDSRADSISKSFAQEVDALREIAIDGKKEVAEAFGVEAPVAEQPTVSPEQAAASAEIDAIDGLTPETKAALKNPQIKAYFEGEDAKVQQAQQAYKTGLDRNEAILMQTFTQRHPSLAGCSSEQEVLARMSLLAQVDRPAFDSAVSDLKNFTQIQHLKTHHQQYEAQQQQQKFFATVQSEDKRLTDTIGEKAANEANAAVRDYLIEHGVRGDQLISVMQQNPVLATVEGRQTIWEAAKYRAMKNAAKAVASRDLPPVQKPGTAQHRSSGSYDLGELDAKVSTTRGDKQLRAAADLMIARRGSR
jgi:hypothetical protein